MRLSLAEALLPDHERDRARWVHPGSPNAFCQSYIKRRLKNLSMDQNWWNALIFGFHQSIGTLVITSPQTRDWKLVSTSVPSQAYHRLLSMSVGSKERSQPVHLRRKFFQVPVW